MKNKYIILILLIATHFCFNDKAHCELSIEDIYNQELCAEGSELCYSSYRYVTVGVGPIIIIPNIGVGYRKRFSQFGWDTALSFSTIGYAHQLSAHLVGHYYLDRFRRDSGYLGLGLIGSGIFINDGNSGGTLSPDFVFGKELKRDDENHHFLEMHVAIPTLWLASHAGGTYFPLMYIKYGFSF